MWINIRDREPEKDGEYMTQSVYGKVNLIFYTVEYGWNTFRDSKGNVDWDGEDFNAGGYLVRWFEVPEPEPVPQEWVDEWENHYIKEGASDAEVRIYNHDDRHDVCR